MILASVRMNIPRRNHDDALKILRSIAEESRILLGCISSRVYTDTEEDTVIAYEETWKSEEDLESHLRSKVYNKLLLVMEMSLQSPEVNFHTVSTSGGIEMIEKARSSRIVEEGQLSME